MSSMSPLEITVEGAGAVAVLARDIMRQDSSARYGRLGVTGSSVQPSMTMTGGDGWVCSVTFAVLRTPGDGIGDMDAAMRCAYAITQLQGALPDVARDATALQVATKDG